MVFTELSLFRELLNFGNVTTLAAYIIFFYEYDIHGK